MVALLCFVIRLLTSPFKPTSRLEAENAALRHQLIVLQRKVRGRIRGGAVTANVTERNGCESLAVAQGHDQKPGSFAFAVSAAIAADQTLKVIQATSQARVRSFAKNASPEDVRNATRALAEAYGSRGLPLNPSTTAFTAKCSLTHSR